MTCLCSARTNAIFAIAFVSCLAGTCTAVLAVGCWGWQVRAVCVEVAEVAQAGVNVEADGFAVARVTPIAAAHAALGGVWRRRGVVCAHAKLMARKCEARVNICAGRDTVTTEALLALARAPILAAKGRGREVCARCQLVAGVVGARVDFDAVKQLRVAFACAVYCRKSGQTRAGSSLARVVCRGRVVGAGGVCTAGKSGAGINVAADCAGVIEEDQAEGVAGRPAGCCVRGRRGWLLCLRCQWRGSGAALGGIAARCCCRGGSCGSCG